jgi:hypothetical protein
MKFRPGVHAKGGRHAAVAHVSRANDFYAPLIPIVTELHRKGLSLRDIAGELERLGLRPRYNRRPTWEPAQVRRILERAAKQSAKGAASARPANVDGARATRPTLTDVRLLIDRQEKGPFEESLLRAMLEAGTITPATLARVPPGGWQRVQNFLG